MMLSAEKRERLAIDLEVETSLQKKDVRRLVELTNAGYELNNRQKEIRKKLYLSRNSSFPIFYEPTGVELAEFIMQRENWTNSDFLIGCQRMRVCDTELTFEEKMDYVNKKDTYFSYHVVKQRNDPEFLEALMRNISNYSSEPGLTMIIYDCWKPQFEKYVDAAKRDKIIESLHKKNPSLKVFVQKDDILDSAKKMYGHNNKKIDNLDYDLKNLLSVINDKIQRALEHEEDTDERVRLEQIKTQMIPKLIEDYLRIDPEFRKVKMGSDSSAYEQVLKNLEEIKKDSDGLLYKINKVRIDSIKKDATINTRYLSQSG